ncbi:single-stranded DNA-binding protein [Leifsonia sp. 71-9]|uniref:single-stranded DNA-binding protein n=1 Tax=Leifsonia sp. 71-9 TaxID=1895934 RepID=UPI00092BE029|nr:single-stranded DNA-binding protein [Leifsonia sp. 71-9]OJX81576.1 MAG: hypothetical protein BGO91_04385 [Leifsonia sp. 71-9]
MDGSFTVRGVVATRPRHVVTEEGLAVTSFRLLAGASRDRSWFTVSALRRLAVNAAGSLEEGDPVLVIGRLVIREWGGEHPGAAAEVEAAAIGHDLARGRSAFTRVRVSPDASPAKGR